MRHFSQFSGLLPYYQNTALKRKCKVSFVLCFVLKILFENKIKLVVRELIPLVIVRDLIFFALFQNICYQVAHEQELPAPTIPFIFTV